MQGTVAVRRVPICISAAPERRWASRYHIRTGLVFSMNSHDSHCDEGCQAVAWYASFLLITPVCAQAFAPQLVYHLRLLSESLL